MFKSPSLFVSLQTSTASRIPMLHANSGVIANPGDAQEFLIRNDEIRMWPLGASA